MRAVGPVGPVSPCGPVSPGGPMSPVCPLSPVGPSGATVKLAPVDPVTVLESPVGPV